MDNTLMNDYQFTQLPDTDQKLLSIFRNQMEMIKHVKTTNGNVLDNAKQIKCNERWLFAFKVVGVGVVIWFCISQGLDIPFMPI